MGITQTGKVWELLKRTMLKFISVMASVLITVTNGSTNVTTVNHQLRLAKILRRKLLQLHTR